jgi:hypothetical protein
MRRQKVLAVLSTLGTLGVLLVGSLGSAAAAATTGGNGLRVSPVRSDITVSPGQSQQVQITVTNVTTDTEDLQAVVNDFTANSDESGDPVLILGNNQYAPTHSLKRFVQPIPSFTLQPGEEKTVTVDVKIPAGTAGGGYYGAVRFAPASENSSQTVTLAGSVGSLIIATVPGNITDKLSIASFDVTKNNSTSTFFTSKKNIDVAVRFQNEGNIQEQPFGKVLLKSHSGKVLGEYEVNNTSPRGNVLPGSIRKFSIPLDKVGSFGIFKVEGNFGYASNGQLLSASTSFYVIPVLAIVIFVAIVLALLFFVFGLPRVIRSYNQRVLRQASRR